MTVLIGVILSIVFGGLCIAGTGVILARRDPFKDEDLRLPERSAEEHLRPLRQPSPAEPGMTAHLEKLGHLLPLQGLSEGRAAKVAKRLRRHTLKVRGWQRPRHVVQQGLPRPAAPLPPLPPPPAVPAPELHAAPVAGDVEMADGSLAESHARALDALAWLDTPLPGDEETATQYPDWKTGQFAAYMKGEAS